jgi:hypothetical protein
VELGRPNPSQLHRGRRFYATVTSHVRLLPYPCITINNLPAIYPNDHHFNCPNIFLPLAKSQHRNFVPYMRLLIIVCSQVMPLLYARFISIDCFASSTSRRRARNNTWLRLANARSEVSRACRRYCGTKDGFWPRIFHLCKVESLRKSNPIHATSLPLNIYNTTGFHRCLLYCWSTLILGK